MPRDRNGIVSFDVGGVTGRGDGSPLEDSKGGSGGGATPLEDSKGGSGGTLEGYYYVTTCREQPNNAMIIVTIMGIIICMIIRNIII